MIVKIDQMNQKDVLRQLNTKINVLTPILIAKMEPVLRRNGSVMDVQIVFLEMMKGHALQVSLILILHFYHCVVN